VNTYIARVEFVGERTDFKGTSGGYRVVGVEPHEPIYELYDLSPGELADVARQLRAEIVSEEVLDHIDRHLRPPHRIRHRLLNGRCR